MVLYYDDHACPPLVQERKARGKAGETLTPIGANGYYIPIHPLTQSVAPVTPRLSVSSWFGAEIIDLFPWRGTFRSHDILLHAIGIGLAALVTWVWLLGAAGKLSHGIVLGWWLVWSAYELATRMNFKSQVKEGPWWERNFREANWADMAAHVGLKNLLIAALLFLFIDDIGVAGFLQALPEMQWFD
jgi:NosR/NirI family nitrous oxide reductase transcriptional regulator